MMKGPWAVAYTVDNKRVSSVRLLTEAKNSKRVDVALPPGVELAHWNRQHEDLNKRIDSINEVLKEAGYTSICFFLTRYSFDPSIFRLELKGGAYEEVFGYYADITKYFEGMEIMLKALVVNEEYIKQTVIGEVNMKFRGRIKPGTSVMQDFSFGSWPYSAKFRCTSVTSDLPPVDLVFDFDIVYDATTKSHRIYATAPGYGARNDYGDGGFILRG